MLAGAHAFYAVHLLGRAERLVPWSDRVFFLVFRRWFDLDAFPYDGWIFLTQFCNFLLLGPVVRRVTGRRLAGFLAPILWTGNAAPGMTMAWACLYKDIPEDGRDLGIAVRAWTDFDSDLRLLLPV